MSRQSYMYIVYRRPPVSTVLSPFDGLVSTGKSLFPVLGTVPFRVPDPVEQTP